MNFRLRLQFTKVKYSIKIVRTSFLAMCLFPDLLFCFKVAVNQIIVSQSYEIVSYEVYLAIFSACFVTWQWQCIVQCV